jgi:hypothetical protein
LLALRLAPDMFPLATQLRFLAFQAQVGCRLRGGLCRRPCLRSAKRAETAGRLGSWAEAKARVADAASFLATIGPGELDGAAFNPLHTSFRPA